MVDTIQRPVIVPKIEIFEQRAAWRQVLGDRAPLAARAQDVHQAVHDFTDIDAPPAPASLGRWYQWRDKSPFPVRHVTRIAKLAAIIRTTVFRCPHRSCPPVRVNTLESHPTHMIQQLFGRTLTNGREILRDRNRRRYRCCRRDRSHDLFRPHRRRIIDSAREPISPEAGY